MNYIKHISLQHWIMIIETIFIIMMLAIIFLRKRRYIIDLVKWIKPSAEGINNTASGRRLTAFAISILSYIPGTYLFWYYAFTRSNDHLIDPWVFIAKFAVDILFVGLLWGFINQQTLVALKNGGNPFVTTKEEKTVSTIKETTTKKIEPGDEIPDEKQ